jgi:chitin disaccharide deacetylase
MIVVNADDFGFTAGVTDGIMKAYKKGIVTHASIMANGLDFDRSIECSKNEVAMKVGVHLVATWGEPVLKNNKKSTLINSRDGRFFTFKQLILRLIFGKIKRNDILNEWEEQIKKVYRAGIKIDHLNSHHHIHMLPIFNGVVYELAKKYDIKRVRVTKEKITNKDRVGVFIKKSIFIALDFFRGRNGVYDFHGLALQSSKNYKTDLIVILKNMGDNSELMVHPGIVDNELLNEDIMSYSREHELKNISDYDVIKVLKG